MSAGTKTTGRLATNVTMRASCQAVLSIEEAIITMKMISVSTSGIPQ